MLVTVHFSFHLSLHQPSVYRALQKSVLTIIALLKSILNIFSSNHF